MAFNQEWENVAVVGKGGSSTVYKAILKSSGTFVAVKQIEIDGLSKDQISGIKGEIETMKDLSHPNILRYLGTQQSPNRVFIFLEYADRGSLRHFYSRMGPLTESQVTFCLQGIVAGLNYLHVNGIAHRDIKCANCLLGSEGVVKLADFGASKRFESDSIVSGLKGTPHWMAPEVIKGTQMTTGWMKADVWSLGCTVVEMFTAKVPYAEYENPMTAMYKIASGEIPSLRPSAIQPNIASADIVSFIETCCAVEPVTRPSAGDLLMHALLTRDVGDIGNLFIDTSLIVNTDQTVPIVEESRKGNSPMLTEHEKETQRALLRRSFEAAPAPARSRADSRSSVLSAPDDDDTTIFANAAEASYLEDDFCSYGLGDGEDDEKTRSHEESHCGISVGAAVGIGMSGDALDGEDQAESVLRPVARLAPLSVPRVLPHRGPSRGHMVISTSAATNEAECDDDPDAAESNLDDVATPSVFRPSVQAQIMPLLSEEVNNMALSDSHKATVPALTRKWSETAFPEKLLAAVENREVEHTAVRDKATNNKTEESQYSSDEEDEKEEMIIAESADRKIPISFVVPAVPSFEDASEVYKSMLMKYSPRPNNAAEGFTGPSSVEPNANVPISEDKAQIATAEGDVVVGSAKEKVVVSVDITIPEESSLVSNIPVRNSRKESENININGTTHSLVAAPKIVAEISPVPAEIAQNVNVNLGGDLSSGSRSQRSKAKKPTELAPLVGDVSGRRQPVPAPLSRPVVPTADHIPLRAQATDASRPNAPLSGDKLRIHSFGDSKKQPLGGDGPPRSSAEVLDRIVSQSGSAAVRKNAAQDLREVRVVHSKAKGPLSHVMKVNKRPRNQNSPRRAQPQAPAQYSHQSNQLGSAHHDRVTANMGMSGGASLLGSGGVRSQSAGVSNTYSTSGYGGSSGARKESQQKLPPVLRGMNRSAIGSTSGSIDPIEEGRVGRGVLSGDGPMLRLNGNMEPTSRYIQSAPAVSRSLNLPPIVGSSGAQGSNRLSGHRYGSSVDTGAGFSVSGVGGGGSGGPTDETAYLTSMTPKLKQPRLHNFGRPVLTGGGGGGGGGGPSAVLQQSFANVMKNYSPEKQQGVP